MKHKDKISIYAVRGSKGGFQAVLITAKYGKCLLEGSKKECNDFKRTYVHG